MPRTAAAFVREHVNVHRLRQGLALVEDVDVVVDLHVDMVGSFTWLRLRRPRKIRRIRVDPRAIGMHYGPLMDMDSADLRG